MKTRRPLPPTYLLVSIFTMVLLHFLAPVSTIVSFPWKLLGIITMVLGIFLNIVADAALKKHNTTVKPFEVSTTLITGSVYRISRHPMYLGMVLILTGIAFFLGTLAPYIVVVVFALLMELIFVRTDEKMLLAKFDEEWVTYSNRVRRWV